MATSTSEEFVKDFLAHAYDPAKAHAYYERTKKLKGRKPGSSQEPPKGRQSGTTGTSPTNKHRATAIATAAAAQVGPERSAAIQQLSDKAKADLDKLTQEFRDWVNSHPRATTREKIRQRDAVIGKKNQIISKLKSDVAKITSAAASKSNVPAATEGRHH